MERKKSLSLLRVIFQDTRLPNGNISRFQRARPHWRWHQCRKAHTPADDPSFTSVVDTPARLISTKRKHTTLGVLTLALIPFTAFCLGSWQVQRLDWKTKLIAKFEDRLVRPPLPLPPRIDPSAVKDFDYRRVLATGT